MHRQSHVTGFRLYNITYSLLLSISTTILIFPWWNVRKLPLIDSVQRKLKSNRKPYLVAVQYGGLASSKRKFTFAISSPDEFLVIDANANNMANVLKRIVSYSVPAGSSISTLCPGQPATGMSASDSGVTVWDNPSWLRAETSVIIYTTTARCGVH